MTAYARINITGNAAAEIKKLTEATKELNAATGQSVASLTKLEKAAGADKLGKAAKGAKEFASSGEKIGTSSRRAASGAKALGDEAGKAAPKVTRAAASTTSYARASTSAGNASKAATAEVKRAAVEAGNYTRAVDRAANATKRLADANRRVSNPFNRAGSLTAPPRAMSGAQGFAAGFEGAIGRIGNFTDGIGGALPFVLGSARTWRSGSAPRLWA